MTFSFSKSRTFAVAARLSSALALSGILAASG